MSRYITMKRLANEIHEAIASDKDKPWLCVELDIPYDAQYMWHDDYGAPRTAHLPVKAHIHLLDHKPEKSHSVFQFVIPAEDEKVDVRVIYQEAILWGQEQYGSGDGGDKLPRVPNEIALMVHKLLG